MDTRFMVHLKEAGRYLCECVFVVIAPFGDVVQELIIKKNNILYRGIT